MSNELFAAIANRDIARVKELLRTGHDPNQLDSRTRCRPLYAAIEEVGGGGSYEVVRVLLQHGAKTTIDEIDARSGLTALGWAAKHLHLQLLELLLRWGANPAALDAEDRSPLDRLPERSAENDKAWRGARMLLRQG